MKRVFVFFVLMLLPLSLMAMKPVSDGTLSDVTGQAGVNIAPDLNMDVSIGTMAWGDATGIDAGLASTWTSSGTSGMGYVGMTNFNITNMRVKLRENDSYNGYSSATSLKPITIDVATDTTYSAMAGRGTANTTYVRFGLGALQINMDRMSVGIEMGGNTNLGQVLGTVNVGPLAIYINPNSYIDIYSHAGVGVNFTFNITVDQLTMDYLSWGDTDGLPAGSTSDAGTQWIGASSSAGYVGLQTFIIHSAITITGTVAIDVVTATSGWWYDHPVTGGAARQTTVVHITFPENFMISIPGAITANVVLGDHADLATGTADTLGDIFISNFILTVKDTAPGHHSSVDIWAH